MRMLLLAASAIVPLLAGGPAQAADIPAKTPIYKGQPPVSYNWTGLYVGGHLGAGWSTNEWRLIGVGVTPSFNLGSGTAPGFLGGAQVGVNYQVDAMVFGLEADASWAAELSGQFCDTVSGALRCNTKADRFATVTGRLGIAADRALVYFKGGTAWVRNTHVFDLLNIPEDTVSSSKWGWTAGAGIEYALTRNWSAKLEYDFMDFGTSRFDFYASRGAVPIEIKQRIQALKFGWNYKFDWGGPVAASY
jgi:outer membrane immunogenic protein